MMMGVSWRRWKNQVKATSYDPNIPLSELVSIRPIPHDLTPEVWQTLCRYWKSNERTSRINRENGSKKKRIHAQGRKNIASLEYKFDLLNDAVQRHLQDKPKGTQPTEVHEEAFREIFGPKHSGRVRCLGDGALRSQVFLDQYKRRLFLTQSNIPTSDVTNKLREMEDKMRSMEEQMQEEMERMRHIHEHQLQNFTRVIQSMISGTAGGSREPELLPTQMAAIIADIMQQQTNTPKNAHESRRSPSMSESDSD